MKEAEERWEYGGSSTPRSPTQLAKSTKLSFSVSFAQSLESLQVRPEPSDRLHWRGAVEEAQASHLLHTSGPGAAERALWAQYASIRWVVTFSGQAAWDGPCATPEFISSTLVACPFRHRNNRTGPPAGLRARSDPHLVLQQATGPEEHRAHDVQGHGLGGRVHRGPSHLLYIVCVYFVIVLNT